MKTTQFLSMVMMACLAIVSCKKDIKTSAAATVEHKEVQQQSSTNTSGSYFGILPCASCPGIETTITIDANGNYTKRAIYQETNQEVIAVKGTLSDLELDKKIEIDGDLYLLEKGQLRLLKKDGTAVSGQLAESYILKKQ